MSRFPSSPCPHVPMFPCGGRDCRYSTFTGALNGESEADVFNSNPFTEDTEVRQLRLFIYCFGPFCSSRLYRPPPRHTHAPHDVLYLAHAYWMLSGACNSMVPPIHVSRPRPKTSPLSRRELHFPHFLIRAPAVPPSPSGIPAHPSALALSCTPVKRAYPRALLVPSFFGGGFWARFASAIASF